MEKQCRRSFSMSLKLEAIAFSETNGNRQAAKQFNVDESMIRRWRKQKESLIVIPNNTQKRNRRPKWPAIDAAMKKWVIEQRLKGHQVHGSAILREARSYARQNHIVFNGSSKWVFLFMKRNNLVRRAVTCTSQHLPSNWEEKVKNFRNFVTNNMEGLEHKQIGNMDKVSVSFDLPSKFTVAEKGSSDVKITSSTEKCDCTVALAVTADGNKLPPYIVFKRKTIPKGNFPSDVIVSANQKGWMSSVEMELWFDKVWSKRPGSFFNKNSVLILDSARSHKTDKIKKICKRLHTIPATIPSELTSKLQPLDISMNKSFKSSLKKLWEEWMLNGYKQLSKNESMKGVPYDEILLWISKAWHAVTSDTIKTGFRKTGINFYDESEEHFPGMESSSDLDDYSIDESHEASSSNLSNNLIGGFEIIHLENSSDEEDRREEWLKESLDKDEDPLS